MSGEPDLPGAWCVQGPGRDVGGDETQSVELYREQSADGPDPGKQALDFLLNLNTPNRKPSLNTPPPPPPVCRPDSAKEQHHGQVLPRSAGRHRLDRG